MNDSNDLRKGIIVTIGGLIGVVLAPALFLLWISDGFAGGGFSQRVNGHWANFLFQILVGLFLASLAAFFIGVFTVIHTLILKYRKRA
jgi:hypothetical protein